MSIDVQTVFVSSMLTGLICTLIVVILWRTNQNRFAGTAFWMIGSALHTAALFMFLLSGRIIPAWIEIALFNPMVVAGMFLAYRGLECFLDKKGPHLHNYLLLAVFIAAQAYFTFFKPDLTGRIINLSVMLMIISFKCMWLLLYRVDPGMRTMTRTLGIVFGGYCIVSLFRIAQHLIMPQETINFLQTSAFDIVIVIAYQMLFIILTYSLTLMVNKRLLIELQVQQKKYSSAFHSSPYAIILTQFSDGKIFEVNEGFEKLTGYATAEALGKKGVDLELWADEDDRSAFVTELLKTGNVMNMEFRFRKKSGDIFTGLVSASIISIDGQQAIFSSISDITERKQLEKTVQEAQAETEHLLEEATQSHRVLLSIGEDQKRTEDELIKYRDHLEEMVMMRIVDLENEKVKAEKANRAKSVFISNMSHELRTPLNAILGFSQLIIDDPLLSSTHSEKLKSINRSGKHLLTLINKIIDISKIEGEEITAIQSTFSLKTMVNEIEKLFRQKAQSKKLGFSLEQRSEIPEFIETDEKKLWQILLNLMDNAVKFTEVGKIQLRVSVTGHEKEKVTLLFELEDTGPGIPDDELESLFKPFSRSEKSKNISGAGLGLAQSSEFATLLGGSILVHSEVGKGSLFTASVMVSEKGELPVKEHRAEKRTVSEEIQLPLTTDALKGLPDDHVEKILSAIASLDQEELIELIDNVAGLSAETSAQMRILALNYKYDELITLFETRRNGH